MSDKPIKLTKSGKPDMRGKPGGTKDVVSVKKELLLELFEKGVIAVPIQRRWLKSIEGVFGVKFTDADNADLAEPRIETLAPDRDSKPRERVVFVSEEL